jgi:molybdenum transport protein
VPHRLGLSETILIFAEHRAFLGALTPVETMARVRRGAQEKKIVVEVGSIEDGVIWAKAGADVIQTEKFKPDRVAELAARLRDAAPETIIAAAGGIGADSAGAYAEAGARVIVTSAPYAAKPLDVAVRIASLA